MWCVGIACRSFVWDPEFTAQSVPYYSDFVCVDHSCGILSLMPNLLRGYGWNPGRKIYKWFGEAIHDKTGKADLTFMEVSIHGLIGVISPLSELSSGYKNVTFFLFFRALHNVNDYLPLFPLRSLVGAVMPCPTRLGFSPRFSAGVLITNQRAGTDQRHVRHGCRCLHRLNYLGSC
jgi:hypothetical protein